MPVCDVCGEDEYYEEDGQFYCTVCNTQSQSMVVMEQDDSQVPSQQTFGLLREIGHEKKQREKKSEFVAGRPWTKYEAYQLILQGQAEALMAHRAHPSVKEAMLRLWAKYLSLLGVAFVGEGKARLVPAALEGARGAWHSLDQQRQRLEKVQAAFWSLECDINTHSVILRELHRGGMEAPEVNPKAMKRKLKRNEYTISRSRAKRQKLESHMDKESMSAALQGETFYEGDNPIEENDDSDKGAQQETGSGSSSPVSSDSDTTEEEEEDAGDHQDSGARRSKACKLGKHGVLGSVQHMNLPKTLAFGYLGCIFTSNWITVSDILRWVSDGSLPYLETTHLLLPDMKLSAFDQRLFTPTHVTSAMLRYEAGRLLRFLGFDKVPEFPVKYISMAYTLSLDLPEALVPVVAKLVRQNPVDVSYKGQAEVCQQKSLPKVDALCAAYVLVTLKLIFGLNDNQERLLSKYTKEVQAKVGQGVRLFDWCAWQSHATRKFLPGLCLQRGSSSRQDCEVMDVDALCRAFHSAGYKDQTFSHNKIYTKRRTKKAAAFQQEKRELLKRPLAILLGRWKNRDANAERIRAEENAAAGSSGEAVLPETTADYFRSSILEHILFPEKFLRSHLGYGPVPSASVSPSSCSSTQTFSSYSASATRTPSPLPSSSRSTLARTSVKQTPKSKKKAKTSAPGDDCHSEDADDPVEPTQMTTEQTSLLYDCPQEEGVDEVVCQLLEMHSSASAEYVRYPRLLLKDLQNEDRLQEARVQQHRSYKWLLKVLSRLTHCPENDIEMMVWQVEQSVAEKLHQ